MASHDRLPVQFAPARGARLAYQVWGEGPATIVAIPPLAHNIEVAWEWPEIREMLERFGTFSRYLHFDKRGTGASDRQSRVPGIDERVDDIRAVMDHAGIERAHFFVQSDGGPMAILFAVTYPERVESLILSGSGPNTTRDLPEDERIVRRDRMVAEWGTPQSRMVDVFAPSMASNQEFRDWWQRYERHAASADSLRDLLDVVVEMDVTEVLGDVTVPTLVIHRTGDRVVAVEKGRQLAEGIPGAILYEEDSDDHFAFVAPIDGWMTEVERFVTGRVAERAEPKHVAEVHVTTLGRFAVTADGEELATSAWGSRLARQLCKRLVAARGWPVTRDELIDILWPGESDMRRLGARLSVQLSAVKRVLGGGVIADRETVRLDTEAITTDLEIFYKATDDAAVVAAYTGEFLPEDRYEDWTASVRDEARSRFVAACRRVADRELANGYPLRAAELARRLVVEDEYDESAHRLLVDALISAGESGLAARAHEAWAAAMADLDIEIEPFAR